MLLLRAAGYSLQLVGTRKEVFDMKEELRQTAQANIKKMHATHYFSPSAPKPVCPPLPNAPTLN